MKDVVSDATRILNWPALGTDGDTQAITSKDFQIPDDLTLREEKENSHTGSHEPPDIFLIFERYNVTIVPPSINPVDGKYDKTLEGLTKRKGELVDKKKIS